MTQEEIEVLPEGLFVAPLRDQLTQHVAAEAGQKSRAVPFMEPASQADMVGVGNG